MVTSCLMAIEDTQQTESGGGDGTRKLWAYLPASLFDAADLDVQGDKTSESRAAFMSWLLLPPEVRESLRRLSHHAWRNSRKNNTLFIDEVDAYRAKLGESLIDRGDVYRPVSEPTEPDADRQKKIADQVAKEVGKLPRPAPIQKPQRRQDGRRPA